jgi:hypothetical protein
MGLVMSLAKPQSAKQEVINTKGRIIAAGTTGADFADGEGVAIGITF